MNNSESSNSAKATILYFEPVNGREDRARAQLLLCNISDRPLYYILKCSAAGGVTAWPSSNGRISAKSSARVILTWRRPADKKHWSDVEKPKILLSTHFVDSQERPTKDVTSTRLLAKITATVSATPDSEPPTEQLLLDAVTDKNFVTNRSSKSGSVERLRQKVHASKYPYYQSEMLLSPRQSFLDQNFSPIAVLIFMLIIFLLVLLLLKQSTPLTK